MAEPFEVLKLLADEACVRWLVTLLHFLWQGAAVGVAVVIARTALATASARVRYALHAAALLSLPVCVAVTFWMVEVPASLRVPTLSQVSRGAGEPLALRPPPAARPGANRLDASRAANESVAVDASLNLPPNMSSNMSANMSPRRESVGGHARWRSHSGWALVSRAAPWIALSYIGGVVCFLSRLLSALRGGRRLRSRATPVTDARLLELIGEQAARVKLRRAPMVAWCERTAVPTVLGLLRPIVLLPASLASGLTFEDLAAMIRHEFAHVRRGDLWMNLLQRVIESLLFFHPAVWLISRQLSAEREICCDDLVVSSGCEPLRYAGVMLRMAELCAAARHPGPAALAAGGGKKPLLERRIERLMNGRRGPRLELTRVGMAGLLASLAVVAVAALAPGVSHTWMVGPTTIQAQEAVASREEDPLPAGAALRFGTSRFRNGDTIEYLSVSTDGRIAIAGRDRKTRVFDLDAGEALYALSGEIDAAAISPGGRFLVIQRGFRLQVLESASGKQLRSIELPRFKSYSPNRWLAFTPDGKAVAATSEGSVVYLIDIQSGQTIREFSNANPESKLSRSFATVLGIAFASGGKLMASGGFANDQGDYFVRLWDVESGRELRRFRHGKQSHGTPSLAFSPDTRTLATRSHDGRLRLFDVASGKQLKTFPVDGGGRKLGAVAFSPDGQVVASAGAAVRLYDLATGEERVRIERYLVSGLHFSQDGMTLFGACKGAIYRWATDTGEALTPVSGDSVVTEILVNPDGSRVVTHGQEGDVHIWDGATGRRIRTFDAAWQRRMAMSPDGRFLVWLVEDETIRIPDPPENPRLIHHGSRVRLYDMAADAFVDRFSGFRGDFGDLAFTSDGTQLASVGGRDGVVRLWDFETGVELRSFQAVPDAEKDQYRQVRRAALAPDGKTVAVAYHPLVDVIDGPGGRIESLRLGRQRPVRLWDVATGKVKHQLDEAYGEMAFSPDGKIFLAGNGRVWDAATGKQVARFQEEPYIRDLAFSRDGRFLAAATSGDLLRVWDVATWAILRDFKGHAGIQTVAFGAGERLFSGSADTTVLAWDLSK